MSDPPERDLKTASIFLHRYYTYEATSDEFARKNSAIILKLIIRSRGVRHVCLHYVHAVQYRIHISGFNV
jgi:hypothetical protein